MSESESTEHSGGDLRLARVYDARDRRGLPIIDRPPVDPQLHEALLTYLEAAPVVLAARSLDIDEFAPDDRDVPMNYRTDGTWIWSGSVPHYLRKHGLPPEPGLVDHIRARDFQLPEVDEHTKDRAVSVITGP
ncbi:hypothetical protein BJY24_001760 [Nocardia transvalensis]|uniref:Uncharacterized protein n=1 Tax=Nocardia transvalensis TaxID=37333 RepID=A0A7W9PC07_9NOCA|nr:hypothetical protein [Nocardia transvalensis]MBB5912893.1 hypothetical protein [Nocardia transvalensis]